MQAAVIDLSSDDETMEESETPVITGQQSQWEDVCKSKAKNIQCFVESNQMDFIDHIVLVWLKGVRNGDSSIVMPHNILKAKAKEAISLLTTFSDFYLSDWVNNFRKKMKQKESEGFFKEGHNGKSLIIEGITVEEWPKFYDTCNPNEKISLQYIQQTMLKARTNHLKEVEEKKSTLLINMKKTKEISVEENQKERANHIQEENEKRDALPEKKQQKEMDNVPSVSENSSSSTIVEVDDVLQSPIKSYDEMKDCLKLVENYCLANRNYKALNLTKTMLREQNDFV